MKKLDYLLKNEPDIAFRNRVNFIVKELEARKSDKILEVGCGRGFILNILSTLSEAEFHGIDIAKDHLSIAKKQLKGRNVKVKYASAYELPYPDGSFDKIVSTEVLEHLEHEDKALGEMWRVLKPGGRLVMTVPNKYYPFLWDPINKTLETVFGTHIKKGLFSGIWAHHVRLYDREMLTNVLKRNNFTVASVTGSTYFCFPFAHNIVYDIGKTLMEKKILPGFVVNATHRFSNHKDKRSLNPINWVLSMFGLINTLNRDRDFKTSVCLHAASTKNE
jgi:ubiquinone/menaquinone biosynthesis C-methylase UbiE